MRLTEKGRASLSKKLRASRALGKRIATESPVLAFERFIDWLETRRPSDSNLATAMAAIKNAHVRDDVDEAHGDELMDDAEEWAFLAGFFAGAAAQDIDTLLKVSNKMGLRRATSEGETQRVGVR